MRLHSPASLCLAAAALLAVAPPVRAEPAAELPSCATDDRAFPLTTRLHGGPDSYVAGGGFGTWYLDLTNKTGRTCTGIHPVVVLIDAKRALKPSQPRLEFYGSPRGNPSSSPKGGADGGPDSARPHAVRFETTDEDELVGAFGGSGDSGDFPGFTVGPGKTVTVKVRLAVTSDAVPNKVTANAAVVQRHQGDGDWVGQSNDYRFTIDADPADPAHPHGKAEPADTTAPNDPAARESSASSASPAASAAANPSATPGADNPRGHLTLADELARTGLTPPGATFATTAALLLAGITLLIARRRR
ncbi:hypothetical protein [Streptomyces sp. NBC_00443]|uniref:hypothetical protein n=1 Tax=Streptomyces sp. NBC_00443 TaxID=2975743 RepID=UPI002E229533